MRCRLGVTSVQGTHRLRRHVVERFAMATAGSILGNAVQRLEDPTLLTGAGKYLDDMAPEGTLHVSFVRSTQAYANLIKVDVSAAESMPGVKAVYHAGNDL